MRSTCKNILLLVALSLAFGAVASAQVSPTVAPAPLPQAPTTPPQPDPKPQKTIRRTVRQARVTMVQGQDPIAPQVVTVIHRLSGKTIALLAA